MLQPGAGKEWGARGFVLSLGPERKVLQMTVQDLYLLNITPSVSCPQPQMVKEVEETIEEMLIRLDEFCGMTDMIRSDTSQILDESIPLVKAKVREMNNIYTKIDKLEAFVKMVGHHVSFLEEQVLEAEKTHGNFPHSVRKLLQSATIPIFKNKHTPSAQHTYDLPELYRTEDYFPMNYAGTKHKSH